MPTRVSFSLALLLGSSLGWIGCTTSSAPSVSKPFPVSAASVSLDALIQQHASNTGTQEFAVTRMGSSCDLDGDGRPDQVIVYRLDGPPGIASFHQYLITSISSRASASAPLLVGASGNVSVTGVQSEGEWIRLSTTQRLPTDESCCPTGRGVRQLRLQRGQWVEFSGSDAPSAPVTSDRHR